MGKPIQIDNDYQTDFDRQLKASGLTPETGGDKNLLPTFDKSELGNMYSNIDIKPYQDTIPNVSLPYKTDAENKTFLDKTYRQIKADQQGTMSKAFNSIVGGGLAGVLGGLENISLIPQSFSDNFTKNPVAQIFADMKEAVNQATPIYSQDDATGLSEINEMSDVWQGLKSVVDSAVSFGLPGGAIVKGTSYLTKLGRMMRPTRLGTALSKKGIAANVYNKSNAFLNKAMNSQSFQELAKAGFSGVVSNQLEGTVMAIEMYDNIVKDLSAKGVDEETARGIAQDRANEMEEMNRGLLVSNMFQLHGLSKAMAGTRNIMTAPGMLNSMKASLSLKTPSNNIFIQNLNEAAEEMVQSSVQQSLETLAKQDAKVIDSTKDKYALIQDYLFSDQSLYEGALGFFGGAFQRGISGITANIGDKSKAQQKYDAQQTSMQETSSLMASQIKDFGKAELLRQKAQQTNDPDFEKLVGDVQFLNLAATSFEMGTTGHLEGILDDISKSENKEEAATGVKLKQRLLEWEKKYVEVADVTPNTREAFMLNIQQDLLHEQLALAENRKKDTVNTFKNKVNNLAKSKKVVVDSFGNTKEDTLDKHITIDENGKINYSDFLPTSNATNLKAISSLEAQVTTDYQDVIKEKQNISLLNQHLEKSSQMLQHALSPERMQEITKAEEDKNLISQAKSKVNSKNVKQVEKELEESGIQDTEVTNNSRLQRKSKVEQEVKSKEIVQEEVTSDNSRLKRVSKDKTMVEENGEVKVVKDTTPANVNQREVTAPNGNKIKIENVGDDVKPDWRYLNEEGKPSFRKYRGEVSESTEKPKYKKWDNFKVKKGMELFERTDSEEEHFTGKKFKSLGEITYFKVGEDGQTLLAVRLGKDTWLNKGTWHNTYYLEESKPTKPTVVETTREDVPKEKLQQPTIEELKKTNVAPDLDIIAEIVDIGYNKVAYASSEFDEVVKNGTLDRVDILDENGKITLNPEYVYVLHPDHMLPGTEITLRVAPNPNDIMVYDDGVKIPYKEWKNKNPESNEKIPIEIVSNGLVIGYIHEPSWINYKNVRGESMSIDDQIEALNNIRDRVIEEGSIKTKVTDKSYGKFLTRKVDTIKNNTPNSIVAVFNKNVLTNQSDGTAISDIDIVNMDKLTSGTTYNLIRLQGNKYFASAVRHSKVSQEIATTVTQAIRAYAEGKETEATKLIAKNLGYDILEADGLSNYLKLFIPVKNVSQAYEIDLKNITDSVHNFINNSDANVAITFRPFVIVEKGNVIFGVEGGKKELINYVTKGSTNIDNYLKTFEQHLANGFVNLSIEGFGKTPVLIDSEGNPNTPYKDYMDYAKSNINTNLYSINIGDTDIYLTQPVVRYDDSFAKSKTKEKKARKPRVESTQVSLNKPQKGRKQIEAAIEELKNAATTLGQFRILQKIYNNVSQGATLTEEEQALVKRIQTRLANKGLETADLLGKPFNQGMKIVPVSTTPDETDTLYEGEEIITKIISPQINKTYTSEEIDKLQEVKNETTGTSEYYDKEFDRTYPKKPIAGEPVMVKSAQVEVTVGTKSRTSSKVEETKGDTQKTFDKLSNQVGTATTLLMEQEVDKLGKHLIRDIKKVTPTQRAKIISDFEQLKFNRPDLDLEMVEVGKDLWIQKKVKPSTETTQVSDIESKKADIEKRRGRELESTITETNLDINKYSPSDELVYRDLSDSGVRDALKSEVFRPSLSNSFKTTFYSAGKEGFSKVINWATRNKNIEEVIFVEIPRTKIPNKKYGYSKTDFQTTDKVNISEGIIYKIKDDKLIRLDINYSLVNQINAKYNAELAALELKKKEFPFVKKDFSSTTTLISTRKEVAERVDAEGNKILTGEFLKNYLKLAIDSLVDLGMVEAINLQKLFTGNTIKVNDFTKAVVTLQKLGINSLSDIVTFFESNNKVESKVTEKIEPELTIGKLKNWTQKDIKDNLTSKDIKAIADRTGEDLSKEDWEEIKRFSGRFNYIAPLIIEKINASSKSKVTETTKSIKDIALKDVFSIIQNRDNKSEKALGKLLSKSEVKVNGGKAVQEIYELGTIQRMFADDDSKIERLVDTEGKLYGKPLILLSMSAMEVGILFDGKKDFSLTDKQITEFFQSKFPTNTKSTETTKEIIPNTESSINSFPLQGKGWIPMSLAEKAYKEYSKQYGTKQSLDRIKQRGGFDISEMNEFYPSWKNELNNKEVIPEVTDDATESKKAQDILDELGLNIPDDSDLSPKNKINELTNILDKLDGGC